MKSGGDSANPAAPNDVPAEALLCALVLAPNTFSRNRFFQLFEQPALKRARKRAKRTRGLIRQLLGHGRERAEIVAEHVLDDRVLLRFEVPSIRYQRTTALPLLEASLVHYALHKARGDELTDEHRLRVEAALRDLGQGFRFSRQELWSTRPPAQIERDDDA
jgi:hypothetical protein